MFASHFYTWLATGIEPKALFIWSWVQSHIHYVSCSHHLLHVLGWLDSGNKKYKSRITFPRLHERDHTAILEMKANSISEIMHRLTIYTHCWPLHLQTQTSYYNSSSVCLFVCSLCTPRSFDGSSPNLVGVCRLTSQLPLRGSFSKRSTGRQVNGSLSLSTI